MNKDTQKNLKDRMKAIFELDLEPIKSKLMDDSDGPGWSREQADRCELEYKRFLGLAARFRGEGIVPSVEVDTFWHAHILDTRKYARDCERALGFFMHHTPHYGPRAAADAEKVEAGFARTRALYEQLFGAEAAGRPAWRAVADGKAGKQAAWCARAEDKAEKHAAWCARDEDKSGQQAAWCARAEDEAEKRAAWCAVAEDKAEKRAAWCAVAEDQPFVRSSEGIPAEAVAH
jgi:hypothetical protein